MRRGARIAAVLAAFILGSLATASAQPAPWRLVEATDGALYVIADGVRHRIFPPLVSEEELAAIPEGPPWHGGVMAGPAPPAPVAAPEEPISISGTGSQSSPPFALRGGDYWVQWAARPRSSSCYFGGFVKSLEDGAFSELIGNQAIQTATTGDTQLSRVRGGQYYLDMHTTCEWLVRISPR